MRLLLTVTLLFQASKQLNIEFCSSDLGLESGALADDALTASSSYDPTNVGPNNARLNNDGGGGAWCPREPVSKERDDQWIQVNLTSVAVVTAILTQGRFAGGQGQEYAQAYRLMYWRPGLADWKEYRDSLGRTVISGNVDTWRTAASPLSPPILAAAIRLLPHSNHSRTVCLRLGMRGCFFTEGVQSYTMPQGQVRGATLELLDITYDGDEDSVTGGLSGGLGQLVDGKYGSNDFKATGDLGLVPGYEWLGWKERGGAPLQLDFTFDRIRSFRRVTFHINNHYSRDIQVFARAKIYFSNEEGKFGDDRAVDFLYMPDTVIEDARNVSVNLHGEHGRFVMVQLFFAAKWILISEVTFESELYSSRPFLTPLPEIEEPGPGEPGPGEPGPGEPGGEEPGEGGRKTAEAGKRQDVSEGEQGEQRVEREEGGEGDRGEEEDRRPGVVLEEEQGQGAARYVGLIIGVLLTLISLLLAGILLVIYRGRTRGKETPTHSLLATKIQDKLSAGMDFSDMSASYTPYKAKMRVYGQESTGRGEAGGHDPPHHHRIYTAGFPQLSKKFRSDPVMSDCTDDYAEPSVPSSLLPSSLLPSASLSDHLYSLARPPSPGFSLARPPSPPHYSALQHRGVERSAVIYSCSQPLYSLPQPPRPPEGRRRRRSRQQLAREEEGEEVSSLSSAERLALELAPLHHSAGRRGVEERRGGGRTRRSSGRPGRDAGSGTSASNLSGGGSSGERRGRGSGEEQGEVREAPSIQRSHLKLVERVGRGRWGEVHLCHLQAAPTSSSLVVVKSLDTAASQEDRAAFLQEVQQLGSLQSPHLAQLLGVHCTEEPLLMVTEAGDMGDLNMFLQDHVAESSLSQSPGVATLSYPTLLYMATQIASGLKSLESAGIVHKDVATRNVLVFPQHTVKLSDCGSYRSLYSCDYSPLGPGGRMVPLRWLAWEALLLDVYTVKSDVWAFGVTLWEILTFAREQPHEELAEEKIVESLSLLAEGEERGLALARPHNTPREVYGLMTECWGPSAACRPGPREIELFLQRKNLGFRPDQ